MSGPRILFVVDAEPAAGARHVTRSLALAQALAARGATPIFLSPPALAERLQALAPETPRISAPTGGPATLIAAAAFADVEAVAFDHPELSGEAHRAIAKGRPAIVVDERCDRPLGADLVIDPSPYRGPADYAVLAPQARVLAGPAYALLAPEVSGLRDLALARRGGPLRRILIDLGPADDGAATGRVLQKLRARFGGLAIDVVLGPASTGRSGVQRLAAHDARLTVHPEGADMAMLYAEADAAVGAADDGQWARCVLGLPTAVLVLSEAQRPLAQAQAAAGAALVVEPGDEAALDRAIVRLASDAAARQALSRAGAGLCDGLGAARAAEAALQMLASRDSLPHSQTQQA